MDDTSFWVPLTDCVAATGVAQTTAHHWVRAGVLSHRADGHDARGRARRVMVDWRQFLTCALGLDPALATRGLRADVPPPTTRLVDRNRAGPHLRAGSPVELEQLRAGWITAARASTHCGVGRDTLKAWVRRSLIKARYWGKTMLLELAGLRAYLGTMNIAVPDDATILASVELTAPLEQGEGQ